MQEMFNTVDGREAIANEFYLCEKWDTDWVEEKDMEYLLAWFIFYLAGDVQYDDEGHDYVYWVCEEFKYLDEDEDDIAVDKAARRVLRSLARGGLKESYRRSGLKLTEADSQHHPPAADTDSTSSSSTDYDVSSSYYDIDEFCRECSYKNYVDYFKQITPYDSSARCWVWQTCNELGVFQSTNFGHNFFEASLPVNFFVDFCTDVFGPQFDRSYIDANVRKTNAYYGGQWAYNGTNVVFPNGSEDPWHVLSVYYPLNVNVTSILIDGTSHCYDMHKDQSWDVKALKDARKQIKAILGSWLGN